MHEAPRLGPRVEGVAVGRLARETIKTYRKNTKTSRHGKASNFYFYTSIQGPQGFSAINVSCGSPSKNKLIEAVTKVNN
jgi:hypothetical protein